MIIFLSPLLEMIQGDTVTQPSILTLIKESQNITIHCKYDIAVGYNPNALFWCIQDPNQASQLILSEHSQEDILSRFQNRFSALHDKTEKTFHLNITVAVLSDSATYFCALSATL
ncbi:TVA1 protein, partial [Polyodon spathula]|nr:TVA1 protein [Polyodon spathula]